MQIIDIGPPTTIEPGQTMIESYWFGEHLDVGACYGTVAAEPKFLGQLDVERQGRSAGIGSPLGFPQLGTRSWTYTMEVTNSSEYATSYNIRIVILRGE